MPKYLEEISPVYSSIQKKATTAVKATENFGLEAIAKQDNEADLANILDELNI